MSISAQAFTDGGRTMLGRANNGELLTFDTMVIGAGVAASTPALYPLVALIDHRFNVAITAKVDQGNGILVLDGVINSADIPVGQGFNLCELGLMAHIAAEAPALYSVANVLATTPDYIPDAVENPTAVHAFKIKVVIDRATNVTVVLGTSIDILAENIGPAAVAGVAWPGVFHEKIANTLRFKRLAPGEGIELTENPLDPFEITIGQKTITQDLDLFVALGNPDVFPDFSTIQNALDWLSDYNIAAGVVSTITVSAGRWMGSAAITVDHPNASQIVIRGTAGAALNATSITVAGTIATFVGAAGTFSGMAVGDGFLSFAGGAGPDSIAFCGAWTVSAVAADGSSIDAWLNFVPPAPGATTAVITPIRTYLNFLADNSGVQISSPKGMSLLENVFLTGGGGTQAAFGVTGSGGGRTTIRNTGVSNWTTLNGAGFHAPAGALFVMQRCGACICTDGIFCANGALELTEVYAHGNSTAGVQITGGGNGNLATFGAFGNAADGILCLSLGFLLFANIWCGNNVRHGIMCSNAAHGISAGGGWFMNNAGQDIQLAVLSSLVRSSGAAMAYGTAPVPSTLTADGCWFAP